MNKRRYQLNHSPLTASGIFKIPDGTGSSRQSAFNNYMRTMPSPSSKPSIINMYSLLIRNANQNCSDIIKNNCPTIHKQREIVFHL